MPEVSFSVHATSETAARSVIRTRQFELIVDEPPTLGGDDLGANPVEYILTGLVGCLNVVAHLIAAEQGLNLKGLEIRATGPIDPSRLFGHATSERAGFKGIEVELIPDAEASEEAIAHWLETVESRCPVFDNLTGHTPVRTRVLTAATA